MLIKLGRGSDGTIVYKGFFQEREVAIKRLIRKHIIVEGEKVTLAEREIKILNEADSHPNVIRYYYQEPIAKYHYLALELCSASLFDIMERLDDEKHPEFRKIATSFNPKRALREITSGLKHLHSLGIVHRDIKPQNILVYSEKGGEPGGYRMVISDFGLCWKLESDQTSFSPTVVGVGTPGWMAPEILHDEVSAPGIIPGGVMVGGQTTQLTNSVDIFALGCLYCYCISETNHPFGGSSERKDNIRRGEMPRDLAELPNLKPSCEGGPEAVHLITSMVAHEAVERCVRESQKLLLRSFSRGC